VDIDYIEDGNWKCSSCGRVIAFDEPDEDDSDESLSVWDVADIYLSQEKCM